MSLLITLLAGISAARALYSGSFSASAPLATSFGKRSPAIDACGSVGIPYGSNMFLISDDDVPKYNYTITVVGSDTNDYRVGMWNTCDESHRPRSPRVTDVFPLQFTVPVGSRRSVAFDGGSHGGFVTYQSGSAIPHSAAGVVLGFWGEFVFAHESSDEPSAFDVCAFEALRAGHAHFSGLRVDGRDEVSFIATNLTSHANAILSGDIATNHGCVLPSGPLSLVATVDYRG